MRLRCRFKPMHDEYHKEGAIREEDHDAIFICGDGHTLKAHKVILASSSKFFATLFEDQATRVAVVSVPDIKVDIMKLILHLLYKDRVYLTMTQIKEVGEFITMFGLAWTQFGYEECDEPQPMSAIPLPPVPMKPVELPGKSYALQQQQISTPVKIKAQVPPPNLIQVPIAAASPPQNQSQSPIRRISASPGPAQGQTRSPMQPPNSLNVNGNDVEDEKNIQIQQNQADRRKSRLTPREGTEGEEIVEQEEEDDPENLIRDWMSKLGKREATTQNGPPSIKRQRTEESSSSSSSTMQNQNDTGKSSAQAPASSTNNTCSVCGCRFQTLIAWKWHEERHVGAQMFKCKFCDTLSKGPKQCYIHEKEVHGYSGLQQTAASADKSKSSSSSTLQKSVAAPQTATAPASTSQVRAGTLVYRSNATGKFVSVGSQNFRKVRMLSQKKKIFSNAGNSFQGQRRFHSQSPLKNQTQEPAAGEGTSSKMQAKSSTEKKVVKYQCRRCETISDNAQKAFNHYNQCWPEKEETFEYTVVKILAKPSGACCPVCSQRLPTNSGFTSHCSALHPDYRRLFSHVRSTDELKCANCKELFANCENFQQHLDTLTDGTIVCPEEPKEEALPENNHSATASHSKPGPKGPHGGKARVRRAESPIEHKAQYKVQFHTPPKSARLASRVQAEAEAEAAKKATAKEINFPPVDCPVCGDSDLPNICLHLQTQHKNLNLEVTRVSSELLRCKGCLITFDICDLLDHKSCMKQKKEKDLEKEKKELEAQAPAPRSRRASTTQSQSQAQAVDKDKSSLSPPTGGKPSRNSIVVDVDSLPPGVGRSPIERIEIEDLHSIEAIKTALKCLVCGHEALKLGTIADCLRAHGIHRCSLCFNSYCNKADYGLHLKKCHGAGGNKLKCPLCPKAFANAGQTSGHMYSTHWLTILKENETAMKNKKKEKAIAAKANSKDKDKDDERMEVEGKLAEAEEEEQENTETAENAEMEEEEEEMNSSAEKELEGEQEEELEAEEDAEAEEMEETPDVDAESEENSQEMEKGNKNETKEDEEVDIE